MILKWNRSHAIDAARDRRGTRRHLKHRVFCLCCGVLLFLSRGPTGRNRPRSVEFDARQTIVHILSYVCFFYYYFLDYIVDIITPIIDNNTDVGRKRSDILKRVFQRGYRATNREQSVMRRWIETDADFVKLRRRCMHSTRIRTFTIRSHHQQSPRRDWLQRQYQGTYEYLRLRQLLF